MSCKQAARDMRKRAKDIGWCECENKLSNHSAFETRRKPKYDCLRCGRPILGIACAFERWTSPGYPFG